MKRVSPSDLPAGVFTSDSSAKTVLYQVQNNYNIAPQVTIAFNAVPPTAQYYQIIAPPAGDRACVHTGGKLPKGESCYINVQFKLPTPTTPETMPGRFTYDLNPVAMDGTTPVNVKNKPGKLTVAAIHAPTFSTVTPFDEPIIKYQGDPFAKAAAYTLHSDSANPVGIDLSEFVIPTALPILSWATGNLDCRNLPDNQLKPGQNCTLYLNLSTAVVGTIKNGDVSVKIAAASLTKVLHQKINVTIKSVSLSLHQQYLNVSTAFKPGAYSLSSSGGALFLGSLKTYASPNQPWSNGGDIYRNVDAKHWKQVYQRRGVTSTHAINRLLTDKANDFFATTDGDGGALYSGLLHSDDDGKTWSSVLTPPESLGYIISIARNKSTLYITSTTSTVPSLQNLWYKTGAATTWYRAPNAIFVTRILADPNNDRLYMLNSGDDGKTKPGIYYSSQAGADKLTRLAVSPESENAKGLSLAWFDGKLHWGMKDSKIYQYNGSSWDASPNEISEGGVKGGVVRSMLGLGNGAMYVATEPPKGSKKNLWYYDGTKWHGHQVLADDTAGSDAVAWQLASFHKHTYVGTQYGVYQVTQGANGQVTSTAVSLLSSNKPVTSILRIKNTLYAATDGDGVFSKSLKSDDRDEDGDWSPYAVLTHLLFFSHLASLDGKLYGMAKNASGDYALYRVNDTGNGWVPVVGSPVVRQVSAMMVANNTLYIGTNNASSRSIITYTGGHFGKIDLGGAMIVKSLQMFAAASDDTAKLYAVLCKDGEHCKVRVYDNGRSQWSDVGSLSGSAQKLTSLNNQTLIVGTDKGVEKLENGQWTPLGTGLPETMSLLALTGQAQGSPDNVSPLYALVQEKGKQNSLYRYDGAAWQLVKIDDSNLFNPQQLLLSSTDTGKPNLYIGDERGNVYRYGVAHHPHL